MASINFHIPSSILLAMDNLHTKDSSEEKNRWLVGPFKKAYDRFVRIRGNPREIAWGLAAGIMIGMTPLMGLHTIMVLFIAALFKWNKISAVIGVYISNPLTAPFLYSVTYYIGAKIVGNGNSLSLPKGEGFVSFINFLLQAPEIFWKMFLGGFLLGLPLAVIGYYISFNILEKYQEEIRLKLAKSKQKRAIKKEIRKRKRNKKKRSKNQK